MGALAAFNPDAEVFSALSTLSHYVLSKNWVHTTLVRVLGCTGFFSAHGVATKGRSVHLGRIAFLRLIFG